MTKGKTEVTDLGKMKLDFYVSACRKLSIELFVFFFLGLQISLLYCSRDKSILDSGLDVWLRARRRISRGGLREIRKRRKLEILWNGLASYRLMG